MQLFQETGKLQQMKIYFLFMYADGESSPSETKYLNDILAKSSLSEESVREFQIFCGKMTLKLSTGNPKTVIAEIDELLGEKKASLKIVRNISLFLGDLDASKTMQAQTIWTLINLGYADSEYSEAERAVVNHLIERWEMDPILVAELNDTAETILALASQKEWIQTTSKPYAEINSIIQELDRNIAAMFANVETSISEADIA